MINIGQFYRTFSGGVDLIDAKINLDKVGELLELADCRPREMYKSLFEVLAPIADDVDIFPGHDYGSSSMSTMGFERENNYVLEPRTEEEFVAFMRT